MNLERLKGDVTLLTIELALLTYWYSIQESKRHLCNQVASGVRGTLKSEKISTSESHMYLQNLPRIMQRQDRNECEGNKLKEICPNL
jgi:hypothetical protein